MAKKKEETIKTTKLTAQQVKTPEKTQDLTPVKTGTMKNNSNGYDPDTDIGVYRDSVSGELSGVEINGKTYLGLNPEQVKDLIERRRGKTEVPTGAYDIGQRAKAENIQQTENLAIQQSSENIAEAETLNITPEGKFSDDVPLLGGAMDTIDLIYGQWGEGGLLSTERPKSAESVLFEKEIYERALKGQVMSQVEIEVWKRGLTDSQRLGATIEAIPIIGKLANMYARGLFETPEGAIDEIKTQIGQQVEQAQKLSSMGFSPEVTIAQMNSIEENIMKLRAKIKLLTNFSAELRSNPEKTLRINDELQTYMIALEAAKLKSLNITTAQ